MAELVWQGKHAPYTTRDGQQVPAGQRVATLEVYLPMEDAKSKDAQRTEPSWYNRLIRGDKSVILPSLLPEFASRIDLIYIDPPFMTGRLFLTEQQIAYRDSWGTIDAYLQWLYETFYFLHRLLSPTGSLYVHLDWRAVHYAKVLLDEIFTESRKKQGGGFKNEIIWHYRSGGRSYKNYARKHDTLLLYSKSSHYCFHGERIGERRGTLKRNHMRKETGPDGRIQWTIRSGGRLYSYDEDTLLSLADVWSDISHLHQKDPERTGYATQKPAALLERIILASSEEDHLLLDCFCGSGVTPSVAERYGRRWIACDSSPLAITTTQQRLQAQRPGRPFLLQQVQPEGQL